VPGRPCALEAGAANDPASADADGHRHCFRLRVDQPDYVRLLGCFASFARAALHASVTRRATSYGFHPPSVSIRPSETMAAEADPIHLGSFRGRDRPKVWIGGFTTNALGGRRGGVHGGCADPRGELVFRRLHAWTLKDRSRRSQPVGNLLLCQDVSGRVRRCPGCRTRLLTARRTPPYEQLVRGRVSGDGIARRSLRARDGDTRFERWPSNATGR
jgi:hypothetical protein